MGRKERIVMQRVLAQDALGKLKAVSELFGAEDERDSSADYEIWLDKIDGFERWVFDESPIA